MKLQTFADDNFELIFLSEFFVFFLLFIFYLNLSYDSNQQQSSIVSDNGMVLVTVEFTDASIHHPASITSP